MHFQFGTDEAGYGPNLGPLVITGTLWSLTDPDRGLAECLRDICSSRKNARALHVADSKKVYRGNLAHLEENVLSFLYAIETSPPRTLSELAHYLGCVVDWEKEGALGFSELSLPVAGDENRITNNASRLRESFDQQGVQLQSVSSTTVFPREFNRLIAKWGNKAGLLSSESLILLRRLFDTLNSVGFNNLVCTGVCDKHGGRNDYAGLLQQFVFPGLIQAFEESRERSRYRWRDPRGEFDVVFAKSGESFFPTALASMVSKYLRELFMKSWNNFWAGHVPGLRPTKGYPQDAKRFIKEILDKQRELRIADHEIWRFR